jgi:hypothetical protein
MVLGITLDNANLLRPALLEAASSAEVAQVAHDKDNYGQRYVLDCEVVRPAGKTKVRSNWIILNGEDFSRLTSCYVL